MNGIVSTPQILLDALRHAFVSMRKISLLVIDEAHHGIKKHSTNLIMQEFFHPLKDHDPTKTPHILGLSAYVFIRLLRFGSI
jgi:ERCC4-related helicase